MVCYEDLVSRNWLYLSPEEQKRISSATIGIAGCGVGSQVAILAARLGFQHFVLADGDRVEFSNCNRQAYAHHQVEKMKVVALAENIVAVNPDARVRIMDGFLRPGIDLSLFLDGVDIVLNTMDIDTGSLHLNNLAVQRNIPVVFPLNLGFGSVCWVFRSDSATVESMLKLEVGWEEKELLQRFVLHAFATTNGDFNYLLPALEAFTKRTDTNWPCDPQLGVAAYLTASLVVTVMTNCILGKPIRLAPETIYLDAFHAVSPEKR